MGIMNIHDGKHTRIARLGFDCRVKFALVSSASMEYILTNIGTCEKIFCGASVHGILRLIVKSTPKLSKHILRYLHIIAVGVGSMSDEKVMFQCNLNVQLG